MRKPISVDLRERIVAAYAEGEATRDEVAKRFKVSVGMVKKLLQQQSRTGDLGPRYRFCGRKPRLLPESGERMKALVAKEPDLTLCEIKERLGLDCTIAAVHWVLGRLGLTYKKRRCMQPSRIVPTSPKRAKLGSAAKAGSTRRA